MKNRILILSLALILLIQACASAPAETIIPAPTESVSAATQPAVTDPVPAAATPVVIDPLPAAVIVTPRGDDLEATDPSTVNLASGAITLVEFFRFT
jgi:hypothetical protein